MNKTKGMDRIQFFFSEQIKVCQFFSIQLEILYSVFVNTKKYRKQKVEKKTFTYVNVLQMLADMFKWSVYM